MSYFADRKIVGVLFACASYGMYTLHYATMKWLDTRYSLWQLIFIRSALMLAITLALGGRGMISGFATSPYKVPTAFRGVLQFFLPCAFMWRPAPCRFPR
jgi:S-adenosylmethionine uptake transporter